MMTRRLYILALLLAPMSASATTYYVTCGTGNNASAGTSSGTAWNTAAYLASQLAAGVVHGATDSAKLTGRCDTLEIVNPIVTTSSTPFPTQLPSSGTYAHPFPIDISGAIFDGADVETHTWTQVGSSSTYSATFTVHPEQIWIDPADTDRPALVPQSNATGQWSSTTSYNEYDTASNGQITSTSDSNDTGMAGGPYAVTFSGQGCSTPPAGTFYVQTATAGYVTMTNLGQFCSSPGTASVTLTAGGTVTLTPNLFQNQWLASAGVVNQVGTALGFNYPWSNVANSNPLNDTEKYSTTLSGLQNVQACTNPAGTITPAVPFLGCWYVTPSGSNWTVYVQLADGTSPASHTVEVTHRDHGILLQSVDYVMLQGSGTAIVEHYQKQNIFNFALAESTWGYYSGEGNQVSGVNVFGCGNKGSISDYPSTSYPTRAQSLMGCIVSRPGLETDPHFLRTNYPFAQNNIIGTVNGQYGVRGSSGLYIAALYGSGISGAGLNVSTPYTPFAWNNTIQPWNTGMITYSTSGLTLSAHLPANEGGALEWTRGSNAVQGFQINTSGPFQVAYNYLHDFKGQGMQMGGSSVSSPSQPVMLHHNVVANSGVSPNEVGYNGTDTNGCTINGFEVYYFNNTWANNPDSNMSLEDGCTGGHVWGNIFDQRYFKSQSGVNVWTQAGNGSNGYNSTNGSSWFYFVQNHDGTSTYPNSASCTAAGFTWTGSVCSVSSQVNSNFHDNSYMALCATQTAGCSGGRFASGFATCATFVANFGETGNHFCEDKAPIFANMTGGTSTASDVRLQAGSPQIGAAGTPIAISVSGAPTVYSTADMGAVPYGASSFPLTAPAYTLPVSTLFGLF